MHDLLRNERLAGLHIEEGQIPLADAPVELDAGVDRNLFAAEQADPAAEKGNELRRFAAEAETEIVLIGSFQKKGALFREEQRERHACDPCRFAFAGSRFLRRAEFSEGKVKEQVVEDLQRSGDEERSAD